ncbi:MAG: hypothetical protein DLD55_04165 [candidate division SR1 bacterium]|nr:MAG: hypothetical protein DLD55_04165 [candidate division SR1 bacterium]
MPDIYQHGGFEEIVLYALGTVVLIICGGCVYAFFRAIFLFIFSKGDEKEIKAAWSSIRYMILGLFFTVMLLFISPTLLKFMNVQGADKYTPKAIFTYMGKILSKIGSLGNIIKESQKTNEYNGTLYYNFGSETNSSL